MLLFAQLFLSYPQLLDLEQKYSKVENSLEQKDDTLRSVQEELEVPHLYLLLV